MTALDPHHIRILREWDRHAGTDYAAEAVAQDRAARVEEVRAERAVRGSIAAKALLAKIDRRNADIARLSARLSERVEIPLCAADLAVAASIPLPIARRVWRALQGAQ